MDPMTLVQSIGGLALILALGYWGGQIKRTTDKLCEVIGDHESRIRDLERPE